MRRTGKLTLAERCTFAEKLIDGRAEFPESLQKRNTIEEIWMHCPGLTFQRRQYMIYEAHRRILKRMNNGHAT